MRKYLLREIQGNATQLTEDQYPFGTLDQGLATCLYYLFPMVDSTNYINTEVIPITMDILDKIINLGEYELIENMYMIYTLINTTKSVYSLLYKLDWVIQCLYRIYSRTPKETNLSRRIVGFFIKCVENVPDNYEEAISFIINIPTISKTIAHFTQKKSTSFKVYNSFIDISTFFLEYMKSTNVPLEIVDDSSEEISTNIDVDLYKKTKLKKAGIDGKKAAEKAKKEAEAEKKEAEAEKKEAEAEKGAAPDTKGGFPNHKPISYVTTKKIRIKPYTSVRRTRKRSTKP